jgi:glycerol-3-phosphate dehydrogenase subunit B
MAAVAAARAGADVTALVRAPGATALYSGGMNLVGDLDQLFASQPHHPFVRLGGDALDVATQLDEAVAVFSSLIGKAGLPIQGARGRNGRFADVMGQIRLADLVPSTVMAGDLGRLRRRRLGVLGVAGVGDYSAQATAAALSAQGVQSVAIEVVVEGLRPGASLIDLFRRPAPQLPVGIADIWAYPPGFENLPATACELLSHSCPVHGWRLNAALESICAAAGVHRIRDEVLGFRTRGARLEAAVTQAREVAADSFVLATGRYIGGGLVKSRTVTEPLLNLPVMYEGRRVDARRSLGFRQNERISPNPAFSTGLMVDKGLRPVDDQGRVVHPNLLAAGAILGGYDYGAAEGFGVPLLTGWLAGSRAAA